jgi:hypothetical protein
MGRVEAQRPACDRLGRRKRQVGGALGPGDKLRGALFDRACHRREDVVAGVAQELAGLETRAARHVPHRENSRLEDLKQHRVGRA